MLRLIPTILLLLVLIWLGVRRLEQASLYFPDRQIIATPQQAGLPFEDINLITADGVRIHAWLIKSDRVAAPMLLFCHGNAGNISHRLDKVQRLHRAGLAVFLFDYRGYGESDNQSPSEKGTYVDAEAAYAYLVDIRGVSPARLFVHGESLGGAVATEIACRHPVAGLILESAFTSTVDMARRLFPWLPVRWLIRNRYDTLSKWPKIKAPTLFLHSRSDEIVPFFMAEQNFKAALGSKRFIELTGDHNEGYANPDGIYSRGIASFVRNPHG